MSASERTAGRILLAAMSMMVLSCRERKTPAECVAPKGKQFSFLRNGDSDQPTTIALAGVSTARMVPLVGQLLDKGGESDFVKVYRHAGSQSESTLKLYPYVPSDVFGVSGCCVNDLDGDGLPEIIISSFSSHDLTKFGHSRQGSECGAGTMYLFGSESGKPIDSLRADSDEVLGLEVWPCLWETSSDPTALVVSLAANSAHKTLSVVSLKNLGGRIRVDGSDTPNAEVTCADYFMHPSNGGIPTIAIVSTLPGRNGAADELRCRLIGTFTGELGRWLPGNVERPKEVSIRAFGSPSRPMLALGIPSALNGCGEVRFFNVSELSKITDCGSITRAPRDGRDKVSRFGAEIDRIGDLTGDHISELGVKYSISNSSGETVERLCIIDGSTLAQIADSKFMSLRSIGDIDGDGIIDAVCIERSFDSTTNYSFDRMIIVSGKNIEYRH